ncbi:unnamed protein product, partial [Mesorhabditis spiculigera]
MAGGPSRENLVEKLKNQGIRFVTTIDDVESLIKERETRRRPRRLHDDVDTPYYDFTRYGSYAQMVSWMRALARKYPKLIQFISIGTSHEGRSIDGLEIGTKSPNKKLFWVDGGIHAREWAAPHTALYFINQLISRADDPSIRPYIEKISFVIVPCLNPDGYEFTRSSSNPHVRLWRKNRSSIKCRKDDWGRNRCCRGVDLNRNFDFHFRESGSSDDPCQEIYEGDSAFSEPESRAVRDAVLSRRYRGRIEAFITLHTYSQIWIHPYGHKKDSYPGDIQELYDVGKKATRELAKLYGTKYILGSGADTLYPASGGSEDWAKKHAKIKFVYLLELRPDEKNWDGFILEERELVPTAKETWAGAAPPTRSPDRFRFGNGEEGSCWDARHACKKWVAEKEDLCKTVPVFMRENCAYSCGYC